MVRIKGYGLLVGLVCLLAFSACGGSDKGGGGGTTTGRIGIILSASPATLPADGVSTATVTATVKNTRDDSPVADGTEVTISLETEIGGAINPAGVTTTVAGVATALLTAGTTAGTVTVKAASGSTTKSLDIDFSTPGEAPSGTETWNVQAWATPERIPLYGTTKVYARIYDENGNSAANGTAVQFGSALNDTTIDSSATTTGGIAEAAFTAGSWPSWSEGATITIKAGATTSNSLHIKVINLQITQVTSEKPIIPTGGVTKITAVVKDLDGNPALDGTPVTFASNLLGSTIIPTSAETVSGLAVAVFTAGAFSGDALILVRTGVDLLNTLTLPVGVQGVELKVSVTPSRVRVGTDATVRVEVRDEDGNIAPNGTPVSFSTDMIGASITPEAQTTAGIAIASFNASQAGTANITVTCQGVEDNSLNITVVGEVATITTFASPPTVTVRGSSTITAEAKDSLGNSVEDGTLVTFSTNMADATLSPAEKKTYNGLASVGFTAGESSGSATIMASVGDDVMNDTLIITILPPTVGSIEFSSATPQQVGVKGSGKPEVSVVVFSVRDTYGNPAPDGTKVDFTLFGPKGGEYIIPLSDTTKGGLVATHLQAGTVAGPVRIEASTMSDNGTQGVPGDDFILTGSSIGIAIGAGLPAYNNFSLAMDAGGLNVAGLGCYGIKTELTAFLADRYSNFVAEGTSVNFYTEAGGVTPYAQVDNTNPTGIVIAALQTQGPAPRDLGPAAYYDCGCNHCLFSCAPEVSALGNDWINAPQRTHNPRDGVSTILAATVGEESFDDKNGNGIYDAGESYEDLSEPFLDVDDDEVYDYAEPFTDGVDVNGVSWNGTPRPSKVNGRYDPPTPWIDMNLVDNDGDGDTTDCDTPTDCNGKWDFGEICQGDLEFGVCFPGENFWDKWLPGLKHGDGMWNESEFYVDYNQDGHFDGPNGVRDSQTMIWRSIKQLYTGGVAHLEIHKVDATGCIEEFPTEVSSTVNNGSNDFILEVSDENFNPVDGLIATFSGSGCTVVPVQYLAVERTSLCGTRFSFTVKDTFPDLDMYKLCTVTVQIDWSNDIGSWRTQTSISGTMR